MYSKLQFLISLLLICINQYTSYSQLKRYDIPLYLKPDGDLTEAEHKALDAKFNIIIRGNVPKWVDEMEPGPDRILNAGEGFELINVSKVGNSQSETWIAMNPTNPQNLISTSNDMRYMSSNPGYRMAAFYSKDGGLTWFESTTPKNQGLYIDLIAGKENYATIFDPGIAFDAQGWAYYSYGFSLFEDDKTGDNGVFVSRSKDGGATWGDIFPVATAVGGGDNQAFNDRFLIAADMDPASPYANNVYVTWQRFKNNPGICFSRSEDGGENFSSAKIIGAGNTQSPQPVVGPNGVIYVAYRNLNGAFTEGIVQKSTDGGKNWLPSPKVAQKVYGTGENFQGRDALTDKQNLRVSSYPAIAVDNSNGPRRGWVYVVQSGKEIDGKQGLYLSYSTNEGEKWTANTRIDNNSLRNDIFFPAIAVDPVTGLVVVLYYSSQFDTNNKGVDAYLAYSSDGINYKNLRITPETIFINDAGDVSNMGGSLGTYWGDYTSIVAYDGKIYPLIWWPTSANANFFSLDLYTALITSAPKPPENFMITSSFNTSTQAVLTWQDPTLTVLGEAIGDFKIEIFRDGVKIETVDKGVLQYIDNGLQSGILYNYDIKAVSTLGSSTLVNNTVYAGGNPKPLPPTDLIAKPNENGIELSWMNPSQHIDGTSFEDFAKILIYLDGELKMTYTSNLQAGSQSLVVVNTDTKKFYKITIKAVSKRGESLETESEFSQELIGYAGSPFTYLNEGFDDLQNLIPFYNFGTWGLTQKAYFSAPNSFTDSPEGNYKSGWNSVILAPVVVNDDKTTISFETIAAIDSSGDDWGIVEVSNDFGKTWKFITSLDRRYSKNFTDDASTSQWDSVHRDLKPYVGDTIYIRLSMTANVLKNRDGWYIDNLRIDDAITSFDEEAYSDALYFDSEIYPNPVSSISTLRLSFFKPGEYCIGLYDILGKEIMKIREGLTNIRSENIPVDISQLQQGIYYYRITHLNRTKTIPIVIMR